MKAKLIVGLVGLSIILTGFVIVPAISGSEVDTSYSAFSEDSEWTGTSLARKGIEADEARYEVRTIGASPFVLRDVDASNTALFVVGMERPYTPLEQDALDAFLDDGGNIVILDDEGYASEYTQRHGIKFLRQPILDAQFDRNMSFISVLADLDGEAFPISLNGPVALEDLGNSTVEGGAPRTVFIRSSDESFLDLDSSGDVNVYDKEGPFNIGIRADIPDGGSLYVISDSGWILNTMIGAQSAGDKGPNQEFLDALVRDMLPDGGMVLFDETRRAPASFEVGIYATEKGMMSLFRSLPIIGGVFTLSLLVLAVMLLLQLPQRESWIHSFRPGKSVKVEQEPDLRDMLRRVLEVKVEIDPDSAKDPAVQQALRDVKSVRDDDVRKLLKSVAESMELDVDFKRSETQAAPEAPGPAGNPNPT